MAGAQSILPLRADTVVIEKTGGSGELKIKNSTRDSLGLLVNIGGGRTQFIRARALNDSTVVIGKDTITIKGGASAAIIDTSLLYRQNGNSFGASAVLGTNDNNSLSIETNGLRRLNVLANGNVAIGRPSTTYKFEVDSGSAALYNLNVTRFVNTAWSRAGITTITRFDTLGTGTAFGSGMEDLSNIKMNTGFGGYAGYYSTAYHYSATPITPAALSYIAGFSSLPIYDNASGGALPFMYGYYSSPNVANLSTVSLMADFYVKDYNTSNRVAANGPTAVVPVHYGLYMEQFNKGTNKYGVYIDGTQQNYFGGRVSVNTKTDTTWGVNLHRSIGIHKDSIPILSAIGAQSVLLIDTVTKQVKRASAATLASAGIAAGFEGSLQYKSGSSLAGNTYAKYIDSSRAIETVKLYGGKIVQGGDTAYRFSPYLLSYFFGNSITAGSAITPQYYRWPTRVANGTNTLEKNYGIGGTRMVSLVSGDSAMQERTFLIPTYSATRDAYLFFAYGTNDAVTGSIDTATFRSVYYGVIDDATGKGWPVSRIVVVSPGFFIHSNSTLNARGPIFRDVARSIAIAKGVKFVDTRAAQQEVGEMQTLKLPTDSTHLNEYGNQVWALAVLDTLGQKSGDVRANGYLFGRGLHLRMWANGGLGNAYATNALPPAISITDSTEQVVLEMRAALGSSTDNESNGVGVNSLQNMTTGNANLAFGPKSLQALTTGSNNTAIGSAALYTQTTGDNNTAVGKNAMFSNTTSSENVAIGRDASYSNTTGTANAAGGYRSLRAGTTANNNTGWGYYTLEANTASGNGAFGASALRFNTSGSANNAFGSNALLVNTTGSSNTAMGNRAGRGVTGSFNSLFGANAGDSVTSSPSNVLIGYRAGYNLKTGSGFNIFIGPEAGLTVTTGAENIIMGRAYNAGDVSGLLWVSPKQNEARIYSLTDGKTGFGTFNPLQRVHIGGKLAIDTVDNGSGTDSLLAINNKLVTKIARSSAISIPITRIPIGTGSGVYNTSSLVFDSVSTIKKRLHIGGPQGGANLGEIHLGGSNGTANNIIFYYGQGVQESNSALVNLFAPTYGFSVGVGSLSTSVSTRFTVTDQEATVKTNLYIDSINTGASTDSILVTNSREVKKISGNDLARQVINAGTTDFTITIGALTVLPSLAGAANRTITLPAASSHTGKFIFLWNKNADANLWSFGSTYTDPNGTTASTIANGSYSAYQSTGSEWLRIQNN